jgi:arylsulfatase A-like enzyme
MRRLFVIMALSPGEYYFMRTHLSCLFSFIVIVFSFVSTVVEGKESASRPNIIVILSDDMGYSDLGCYGGEIQTPNLDALAKNGVRFTQFYNTARCCPTRASLLTGLYPHQAGMGHMTGDRGHDGYRGNLSRKGATMAEVLREGGYRTYMLGKWHVTRFDNEHDDNSNWPVQRGFEKFYGTVKGGGNFYDPTSLCRQNKFITPVSDPEYKPQTYYYTDAISDNAVRYLQQHVEESPAKPFFMYVAYTAAHWPMHALEKDIAKYKGKFDDGYGPVRQARIERLKKLGLLDRQWMVAPQAKDWNTVEHKAWESRCMEVYAAMVDNMDQGIGRIVEQLKTNGQFENTIVFYMQDNGGCAENIGRTAPREPAPEKLKPLGPKEMQTRVTPPMQTRDGRVVRSGPQVMPGPPDTFIAYGEGWANVSNTPFREYKHWVHEGGISTPLIAHWPAGIAEKRRGNLEKQPGHLVDIMATCVDVSGVSYPTEFKGHPIQPMEGASLQPAFIGRTVKRKQPLFWEHEGNRAIRDGKWKLVAKENQPWELYDMEKDRTEMTNLAEKNPKKVAELAAEWESMAARMNVLPLGTWRGKVAAKK